jgi:hypothetical protein
MVAKQNNLGRRHRAVVAGLSLFHVDIADQAPDLTNGIYGAIGLIGTIMVIVGRVKARTVITLKKDDNTPVDPWRALILRPDSVRPGQFGVSVTPGCANGPVYPNSPLAVVGSDFTADAAAALQAYADYKAGNVSLTWALHENVQRLRALRANVDRR